MHHHYPHLLRWALAVLLLLVLTAPSFAQQAKPFKLELDTYRGSIQWEQSPDNRTWTPVPNGVGAKLSLDPKQTTYYRARVTEAGCTPVFSDVKAAYISGNTRLSAKLVHGTVELPTSSTLKLSECTVRSFLSHQAIRADGSFELLVADSTAEELLLVTNKQGEVQLMGWFSGQPEAYQLSAKSTSVAMLLLYPWLQPVGTARKGVLSQAYQREPEFQALLQHVSLLLQQGRALFDPANEELRRTLLALVGKSFNDDRLRLVDDGSVTISDSKTLQTTLENHRPYSFEAGVYRKSDTEPFKTFLLAGSLLDNSSLKGILGAKEAKKTFAVNFSESTFAPGEYVIKLRSGAAGDGSDENTLALAENTRELLIAVLDNLSLQFLRYGKAEDTKELVKCMNDLLDYQVKFSKPTLQTALAKGAGLKRNEIIDILIPTISETPVESCNLSVDASLFLRSLYSSLNLFKKVNEALPALDFFIQWPTKASSIDACKFIHQKGPQRLKSLVNCAILEKVNPGVTDPATIRETSYICDDLSAQVVVKEDDTYFPYEGNPLPGVEITWLVTAGNGALGTPPDRVVNPVQTNTQGKSSTPWRLGNRPAQQVLEAHLLDTEMLAKFTTTSVVPQLEVKAFSGNNQTGKPNQVLDKSVIVNLTDLVDRLPVKLDRFNLTWEVVKGGGRVAPGTDPNTNSVFTQGRNWVLGPEAGEQQLKVTIVNKNCTPWVIKGNPFYFTAKTTDCDPANPQKPVITGYALSCGGSGIFIDVSFKAEGPGILAYSGSGSCDPKQLCYPVRLSFMRPGIEPDWVIAANSYSASLLSGTVNEGVVRINFRHFFGSCFPNMTPREFLEAGYPTYKWQVELMNKCNQRSAPITF
ncbi:hypothetical protein GCM10027346_40600 [Hymenobacter seoulensis]